MKAVTTYYDVETGEILNLNKWELELNYIKEKSEKSFNYEKSLIIWRTGWRKRKQPTITQGKLF